jgi:hypothetical protein
VTFSITSLRQQRAHLRYGISARLATPEAPGELRNRLTPYWQTRCGDDGSGASGKEDGVDSRVITIALGSGATAAGEYCCKSTLLQSRRSLLNRETARFINAFSWHQW